MWGTLDYRWVRKKALAELFEKRYVYYDSDGWIRLKGLERK